MRRLTCRARRPARGWALLESLVAVLVLSTALLALGMVLSTQQAAARTSAARAVAMEHLQAWGEHLSVALAAPAGAPEAVGPGLLPSGWQARLQASLPGASAWVFRSQRAPRQVGLAVAWPVEPGKAAGDTRSGQAAFGVDMERHGFTCPAGHRCHLVYVQP